ncbi:GNAT family N-acetyltransferase [Aeromonas bivalvium]|uniref:GNAT family N-acetyltransferase n=1 Tax=Aeromonas bivalvium TaxID=440079 RepID=UPI0038D1249C
MARYLCWPRDEARLRRGLAGWRPARRRADLPLTMVLVGERCTLHELGPEDETRIVQAFAGLSQQSVYLRFMRAKQPPTPEQVSVFLDYPRERQISLLLCDAGGVPLAQAQSVRRRLHPDRAEFSCIVADHFQHKGAGRRLLLALAILARGEGIGEWTAEVLAQNRPMLGLLKGLGLPLTLVTGRELIFVRLDLAALDPLLAASAVPATPDREGE